ncbi:MAG: hypothetical protein SRB1_02971 [Desulfobacteraceae bacterium Eth-SRB1]|nr:MAG: hypothetical protein SRB1_02971 [Desulfobacteraceae bacterium Eth-SRB1]
MSRKHILYVVLAVIVGGIICIIFVNMFLKPPDLDRPDLDIFYKETETKSLQHPDRQVIHLYFADKDNSFLISEERSLFLSSDPSKSGPAESGKQIIEALIHGPEKGLMQTIPGAAKLRALYVTQDGTAYVDLTVAVKEQHPGGVNSELLTIYSIVNSLILNISEINAVKILIGGSESLTLAGHIDLSSPLYANMLLIR